MKETALIVFVLFIFSSCSTNPPKLTITNRQVLGDVASASGIITTGDKLYAIGDNVPWIYQLDGTFKIISKTLFGDYPLQPDSTIAKPEKPDLEALAFSLSYGLLAFGSGSLTPQRDILAVQSPNGKPTIKTRSLQALYHHLQALPALKGTELNIEGAAIHENKLFLFNREDNVVLQFQLTDFISFIKNEGSFSKPKVFKIILPEINGIEAGISGADLIPGSDTILFTASVEDTPNPIDDGEILGSFVGVIDINDLQNQYHPKTVMLSRQGKPLEIKVESVSVLNKSGREAEIILVTDSDGGNSEIINAIFRF